ncbi:DNA-directed RNA polymerase subunit alpha C-terminal domain-containing protein [Nonomuraea sp. NPDC050394]|uniref:DNA-directed RNA polymerase subunit alpha C-terminal domain-containing protein n=1 Tax=Nonomuraea sp. NPDC050394 TaxID=3364363 RepID=UPI00378AD44F
MTLADLIAKTGLDHSAPIKEALPTLTWHVTKPLKAEGVKTIGDLAARTYDQLLDIPQFGAGRLATLVEALTDLTGDKQ